MSRVNNIPRRDVELRKRSGGDCPNVVSIRVPAEAVIGSLKIGKASLCLRVAIEELVYWSRSGGTGRYCVPDVGKVIPLNRGVLTSNIYGGVRR